MKRNRGLLALVILVPCVLCLAWLAFRREALSAKVDLETARRMPRTEGVERHESTSLDVVAEDVGSRKAVKRAVDVPTPKPAPATIVRVQTECDATLIVHVVDRTDSHPIAGIRVSVQAVDPRSEDPQRPIDRSRGKFGDMPLTGEDGTVEIQVPSGLLLDAYAEDEKFDEPGVHIYIQALVRDERREVTARLLSVAAVHVRGRVIDEHDQGPVADARVQMVRGIASIDSGPDVPAQLDWEDEILGETVSDNDGRFDLALGSRHGTHVRADKPGYAPSFALANLDREQPDELRLTLRRGATVLGRVIDAAGAPMPNATVGLACSSWHVMGKSDRLKFDGMLPNASWHATTDVDGRCELSDVVAGAPLALVIRDGDQELRKETQALTLQPGETRQIEWQIGGGCKLCGVMLDQDERPVVYQLVWLKRDDGGGVRKFHGGDGQSLTGTSRTDSEGHFCFDDVSVGTWRVGSAPPPWGTQDLHSDAVAPTTQLVDVSKGVLELECVLHVWRGLFVRGRVVDSHGDPVERVMVEGAISNGIPLVGTTTANGGFVLGPVEPDLIELVAYGRGLLGRSRPLAIRPGGDDVVLQLSAAGVLAGSVVDERTGEPCEATFMLCAHNARDHDLPSYSLPGVGFRFDAVEPGAYDIVATTTDSLIGVLRDVSVAGGQEIADLRLALAKGATLRLLYRGDSDFPLVKIRSGHAVLAHGNLPPGEPATFAVLPGELNVQLTVWYPEVAQEVQVSLALGETKEIELSEKK